MLEDVRPSIALWVNVLGDQTVSHEIACSARLAINGVIFEVETGVNTLNFSWICFVKRLSSLKGNESALIDSSTMCTIFVNSVFSSALAINGLMGESRL